MNRVFAVLTAIILFSPLSCSDSRESAANLTKNAIKLGKEVLGGISQGVDEGRKEAEGVDGAVIVTTMEELEAHVDVQLLKVRSSAEGRKTQIEIGLKNRSDQPVRIANLGDRSAILLLDTEGYAQELDKAGVHPGELTIPARAGKKHHLLFAIPPSKAQALRMWQREFSLQGIPVAPSE